MNFLGPALLTGLVALALPVIAHLFGRRKPRVVRFAAVRLIEQFPPARARQRTLQDLPLLVVRLLILAAVVLAFAQPYRTEQRLIEVYGQAHDAIIMLDISASTNLKDGDTRVSQRVERSAREVVSALPPGSRLGFATSAAWGPSAGLDEATYEQFLASLDRFRDGAALWTDATPMNEAVAAAAPLFGEVSTGDRPRVIYVIGDLTRAGLHAATSSLGPQIDVVLIPVESSAPLGGHVAIEGLSISSATNGGDGEGVRLIASVRRRGGAEPEPCSVELRLDVALVARGEAILDPDGAGEIEFSAARHTEGPRAIEVRLARSDDPLPHDDALYAWLRPTSRVRVRIVNGAPSGDRISDEIFFLTTALGTLEDTLQISASIISPDQLAAYEEEAKTGADPLKNTDLLVLANTPAPGDAVAALLTSYVERGGALLISSGDRVDAAGYNRALGAILPHALRGAQQVGTLPGQAARRLESLEPPNLSHPLFKVRESALPMPALGGVRAERVMLLEPDLRGEAAVALSYERGAPVLVTRAVGAGRVALLTTTIDRDWSSLALDPGFVPLIERLIRWMCEAQINLAQAAPVFAGEPWQAGSLTEAAPRIAGLNERALTVARSHDGFISHDTYTPGLYVVRAGELNQAPLQRFSIRTNPSESETSTSPLPDAAQPPADATPTAEYEHRIPLWRTFALLALLLIGMETGLRVWTARRP